MTYKAMQASGNGSLTLVERPVPQPGTGEVLIKIEACGICGADGGVIDGGEKNVVYPRIPGHEVVGTLLKLGGGVPSGLRIGQRVGVGRLGGHCNACDACRRGEFTLCSHQPIVGSSQDGGYAEMMLAKATGLVAIPDELSAVTAAPLLCAGIATFNAVRKSGAQPGDSIAILGIGGLGHLAVQYAARMGFRVIAIGRGSDKAQATLALGASDYLDSTIAKPAEALKKIGGVKTILTTATDSAIASSLLPALQPKGKLMVLGVGQQPLMLSPGMLVGRELSVEGSLTGTPYETESALRFSLRNNVQPMTEIFPLEQANEAWQKMKSGKARFRLVLTMDNPPAVFN
ncbi:Alcohol dehydrogenase [Beauveria bassiana D1-5]|uniref:Alcohol dehydrogenase n=1 Tax=Beauveria bassiana D1-5 TaxID=1245745 RepID=A0A0A2W088_BEABA|nr:alcohol dehydrogenase [Klebsiella michiganensis]KGQ13308.1 Alcohol dehydrogenase [Beauveria bassiana D1-5]